MTRIFFLNRFFLPDQSATSILVGDLATHLVECGHDVHVITSQQLYDAPHARLPTEELFRGVHVRRLTTTHFGRTNLPGRAVDYLTFYASAGRSLAAAAQPDDLIVAMTDPPLISVVAMHMALRRRAHLVNWLQDIYPEVAVELGVPFLKGPILRFIAILRDRSLQAAAANVVVGRHMADKIAARGVATDRIQVIPNWTADDAVYSVDPWDNPLRRKWQLEDKFVVGYSGNLGRAHEYDTVLAAAEQLKDNRQIVFLCIGGGHLMSGLAERIKERGLGNFQFMGYQDESVLKFSLSAPDVHWISLRPEVEGLIVPSKFYAIAAAGRPMIAICAKDGEIARMVEQNQCGVVIEPGNPAQLVDWILHLSKDAKLRAAMGQNARMMLEAQFSRRQALTRWQTFLEHVGEQS